MPNIRVNKDWLFRCRAKASLLPGALNKIGVVA